MMQPRMASQLQLSEAASISLSMTSDDEEEVPEISRHDSSSNKSGSASSGNEEKFQEELAGKETRAVWRSKVLVVFVLSAFAITVAVVTYRFVADQEKKDFESLFVGFANEVIDASRNNAKNTFNAISTFSSTITSYALDKNASWPNVTLPHFEIRGRDVHELSGSLLVSLTPIVTDETRTGWEAYASENQDWIKEGLDYGMELYGDSKYGAIAPIPPQIYGLFRGGKSPVTTGGPYAPVWQQAPAPRDQAIVNLDLLLNPLIDKTYEFMLQTQHFTLSQIVDLLSLYQDFAKGSTATDPHSFLLEPVYDRFDGEKHIMAFLMVVLPWNNYFSNLVPEEVQGIYLVLKSSCGDQITYLIEGKKAVYVGKGDLHESAFNAQKRTVSFSSFLFTESDIANNYTPICQYDMDIYPSQALYDDHQSNKPLVYAIAISLCFVVTTMVFLIYDLMVHKRQRKVMATAVRTNRIVSSLFPSNVRDRILKEAEKQVNEEMNKHNGKLGPAPKARLRNFLSGDAGEDQQVRKSGCSKTDNGHVFGSQPIADLFAETTILFADIVGFTAWSSVREPEQVFTLLETIYHAFDKIAERRKVFKVETVGDCYVAATGLPNPQKDHAVIMAYFAHDCLNRMKSVCRQLEVTLGPETADLGMRVGLHSGSVTAGVLRGERARFQLFGDTMNTASRFETTGKMNKIHISKDTADLLIAAGKGAWVVPREDRVIAKGKGELESYWLEMDAAETRSTETYSSSGDNLLVDEDEENHLEGSAAVRENKKPVRKERSALAMEQATSHTNINSDKFQRLISWNVEILSSLLKNIVARRLAAKKAGKLVEDNFDISMSDLKLLTVSRPLEEVKEIIAFPKFDPEVAKMESDPDEIVLDATVLKQLSEYVSVIASMYADNPFHNFEHASHVTMSVKKLLARIVRPDAIDEVKDLHDHTYGITSDPLTQFAVVFSALLHDVDHSGVPNVVLVNEKKQLAAAYKGKSVAEQNSVDIAWTLLMSPEYKELRRCICATKPDLERFRQLVVNVVMATDIMDKDLGQLRKNRWDKAFSETSADGADSHNAVVDRKATIVIEHLIQASDVAHTMQHWHIYRKWNEALFFEMYHAYRQGRTDKDPSENWHQGELGFFDYYVIPLAKKLNTCGVFGVSCYEYLGYAQNNRKEWEVKGKGMVEEYLQRYNKMYQNKSDNDSDTEEGFFKI